MMDFLFQNNNEIAIYGTVYATGCWLSCSLAQESQRTVCLSVWEVVFMYHFMFDTYVLFAILIQLYLNHWMWQMVEDGILSMLFLFYQKTFHRKI